MQVRRSEGVAIHIDPKPCVSIREDTGEASAGERIGQPSSRVSDFSQGADEVTYSEGNTIGHASASVRTACVVLDPGMYGRSLCGNREISGSAIGPVGGRMVRSGKVRSRSR